MTAFERREIPAAVETKMKAFSERMKSLMQYRKKERPYEYAYWRQHRGMLKGRRSRAKDTHRIAPAPFPGKRDLPVLLIASPRATDRGGFFYFMPKRLFSSPS